MQKKKKGLYKGKVLGKYMAYLIMEEKGPWDDFLSLPCIEQVHGHPQPREGAADVRIRPR